MTTEETGRGPLIRAIGRVAPGLARAMGGPLAGVATAAITEAILGDEHGDEDAVLDAVLSGDPATMVRLKQVEADLRKAMLDADLEQHRIAASDRENARLREREVRDRVPALLGCAVIAGFFVVLSVMLLRDVPVNAETEFSIMLGALATMTAAVVNYYFGSSADSATKTRLMGGLRR